MSRPSNRLVRWLVGAALAAMVLPLSACAGEDSTASPATAAYSPALPIPPQLAEVIPPTEQPTAISAPSVGMDSELFPGGLMSSAEFGVNPPDDRPAWLAESKLPGENSEGTAVISGHNYGSGENVPFSKLDELEVGDEVVLATPTCSLTYVVESSERILKSEAHSQANLRANVPGRLLLVTCDVRDGMDTAENVAVFTRFQYAQCG